MALSTRRRRFGPLVGVVLAHALVVLGLAQRGPQADRVDEATTIARPLLVTLWSRTLTATPPPAALPTPRPPAAPPVPTVPVPDLPAIAVTSPPAAPPAPAPPSPPSPAVVTAPDPAVQTLPPTSPAAVPVATVVGAKPDHLHCPPPRHPALLRERGIEGGVTLRVRVDREGRAAEVQLIGPSGWRLFDEAALAQARRCRFVPATLGGQAVDSWVEFDVRFVLTG